MNPTWEPTKSKLPPEEHGPSIALILPTTWQQGACSVATPGRALVFLEFCLA